MTEEQCINWVAENLPFVMKGKQGKLQYPFKSHHVAREIEKNLGKDLFKLLSGQKGYEKEFVIYCIYNVASYGETMYSVLDEKMVFTSLDELHEYWQREVKQ